jgi:hypothetical protein
MMRFIFALYLYAGFVNVSFFQEAKTPLTTNEWLVRIGVNVLAVVVLVVGAFQFRRQQKFLGFEPRLFYLTAAICYAAGIGFGFYAVKLQSLLK